MTLPKDIDLRSDPVWRQALDWRRRLSEMPGQSLLRDDFERWLAAHPANRAAYAELTRIWHLSGGLTPAGSSPSPIPAGGAGRRPRKGPGRLVAPAAVAACLLLAALSGSGLAPGADYRTPTARPETVSLADGSTVHLDAASAIDVDLDGPGRTVALRNGQAFFEVAPDPSRPFRVSAGPVSVTVVGTAFDLRRDDSDVMVAVRSGSVLVAADGREARLGPGDQVTIDDRTGQWARRSVDPALVAVWRDGRLAVDGVPVAEVVEEVRRYFPGIIVLRDDDLAERRVTGVYDLADPVAALRAVLHPHGGRVQGWPWLLILSRP
ncbi:MAG: DUF4880 domain-containing protein [Telmatospirillum sp.]|nr:DUF4880 domain-containing protein [Telmatospirillum sp.]